jgi:hypothetical protein
MLSLQRSEVAMIARTAGIAGLLAAVMIVPTIEAQGNKQYVAATDATVITTIQEGYGSPPSAVIYVKNLSTVNVTVYSFALRDCENVKQQCTPIQVNIRVPAGRSAILTHVQPRNPELGYTYRFSFGWRADSSEVEALRVLAEAGSPVATEQLRARDIALSERRAAVGGADVMLDDSALAALGTRVVRLLAVPDSVILRPGQMFLLRQVHILAVDDKGALLGRVLGLRMAVAPGVIAFRADTVEAQRVGRSTIEFRLRSSESPLAVQLKVIVIPDS